MNYFWSKIFRKPYDFKNFEGVKLKFAFSIGQHNYYEPEDVMNLPYQRGLSCIEAYNQLRLGIYPEDLEYVAKKLDEIFEKPRITTKDLIRIKHYHNRIKDRMTSTFRHPDLMYKLASVVFIDETESPVNYDAAYAQKKIEFWKKHKKVTDFFLQIPLTRLIPYLPGSEENSRYCSTMMEELMKEESILTEVFGGFSERQKKDSPSSPSRPSAGATGRSSKA